MTESTDTAPPAVNTRASAQPAPASAASTAETEAPEMIVLRVKSGGIPQNFRYPSADGSSYIVITSDGTEVPADAVEDMKKAAESIGLTLLEGVADASVLAPDTSGPYTIPGADEAPLETQPAGNDETDTEASQ